jgi:hypothetical protein
LFLQFFTTLQLEKYYNNICFSTTMHFSKVSTVVVASYLFSLASGSQANHNHAHNNDNNIGNAQQHSHNVHVKRGGQCKFPTDAGLVAVTPNEKNAGWAMSPDQPCKPGMYCPYACPPGKVSLQWDPSATSYSYPASMNGGLYCNENGEIEKPFPNKDYCADGTAGAAAVNSCGDVVSFCQTVLPGNEAMIIPTEISAGSSKVIAVPDPSYWVSTAAHYYINAPGVGAEEGCVWGSKNKPVGNWSPYVAGANTDNNGNTFVKIGWNPVYLENDCPFKNKLPSFGVRLVCKGGNCNGLPCSIDPSKNGVNEVTSGDSSSGAGGGNFCVGTATSGSSIQIEVFEVGGGSSIGGDSKQNSKNKLKSDDDQVAAFSESHSSSSQSSSFSSPQVLSSSSAPATSVISTSSTAPTSSSIPATSSFPSSTSSTSEAPTTSSTVESTTSSSVAPTTSSYYSSSSSSSIVTTSSTLTSSGIPSSSTSTTSSTPATKSVVDTSLKISRTGLDLQATHATVVTTTRQGLQTFEVSSVATLLTNSRTALYNLEATGGVNSTKPTTTEVIASSTAAAAPASTTTGSSGALQTSVGFSMMAAVMIMGVFV